MLGEYFYLYDDRNMGGGEHGDERIQNDVLQDFVNFSSIGSGPFWFDLLTSFNYLIIRSDNQLLDGKKVNRCTS